MSCRADERWFRGRESGLPEKRAREKTENVFPGEKNGERVFSALSPCFLAGRRQSGVLFFRRFFGANVFAVAMILFFLEVFAGLYAGFVQSVDDGLVHIAKGVGGGGNQIVFEAGSLVGSQDKVYLINKEIAIDGAKKIEPDYFMGNQDFSLTDKKWDKVVEGAALEKVNAAKASRTEVATTKEYASNKKQISNILGQYDDLIKDASYKGVNLLQKEDLNITFNEDNTGALRIKGVDASAKALGIDANDMSTLDQAINQIRSISSELGSYYNIVTTRQDFTESLINVLTEGADKLTLADMNEESANMLALQTRQQLAINSLSLASQASQSILKLF